MELKLGKYSLAVKKATTTAVARRDVLSALQFFGLSVSWNSWDQKNYAQAYKKNAALFSIVSRITSVAAMAAETLRVYNVKDKQKALLHKSWTGPRATPASRFNAKLIFKDAYEYNDNHPFNDLLTKPNEGQGANNFVQECIGTKLLTGNRFIYTNQYDIGADKGRPFEMYNLPPNCMAIIPGSKIWEVLGYEFTVDSGKPIRIPKELIIHSRETGYTYEARGNLWGQSPLDPAGRLLDRSAAAEDRSVAMLQNAGAAGLIFNKAERELSPEQAAEIKREVNNMINGNSNSGAIRVANGDTGFINFAMTAVELAILDQERYTLEQLCNIYKVPPGLFMASANATDNNILAWNRQLISQAVLPALSDLRNDLNKILSLYDQNSYVDWDNSVFPELQEDQEKLANTLNNSPWLTMNEKRLATGRDEDLDNAYMNKYYVNGSLVDLEGLDVANIDRELDQVDERDKNTGAVGG